MMALSGGNRGGSRERISRTTRVDKSDESQDARARLHSRDRLAVLWCHAHSSPDATSGRAGQSRRQRGSHLPSGRDEAAEAGSIPLAFPGCDPDPIARCLPRPDSVGTHSDSEPDSHFDSEPQSVAVELAIPDAERGSDALSDTVARGTSQRPCIPTRGMCALA